MNCNFSIVERIGWGRCQRTGVIKCLDCDALFCTGHIDSKVDVCLECIWTSARNPANQQRHTAPRILDPRVRDLAEAITILKTLQAQAASGPPAVWNRLDNTIYVLDRQLDALITEDRNVG